MKLLYNKIFTLFALTLFIGLITTSCSKDLGNYKYNEINELEILNFKDQYSAIADFDTLRISPEFSSSLNIHQADRYEFRWVIKTGAYGADTIGKDLQLTYPVKQSIGNYTMQLRIKDIQTGVIFIKSSTLRVSTPYTRGILLIGDTPEGNTEAEMLSMIADTLHIKELIKNSGITDPVKGPIQFMYSGGFDEKHKLVWLLSKEGSFYLDRKTMKYTPGSILSHFLLPTDPIDVSKEFAIDIAPQIKNIDGGVGNDFSKVILTTSGNIYSAYTILGSGYFLNPINKIASKPDELIPAGPFLMYPINNISSVLWFDTKNNKFMYLQSLLGMDYSVYLTDKDGDVFSWDLGKDNKKLIYAENTVNSDGGFTSGNSFAVIRSSDNAYNIYKFNVSGSSPTKLANYTVKSIAQNFDKAEQYAFASNRTVVFYTYQNRLYAYDYNPGNEKFYEIPQFQGKNVTMIKFDTQQQPTINSLYVASYDQTTGGTLQRFNIENNPNTINLIPVNNAQWSGLLKIHNMNWKPE